MTRLRQGYRRIPGFNSYAINRAGSVYNVVTGRDLTTRTNKTHWSGYIRMTNDDGNSQGSNIADLVAATFNIRSQTRLEQLLTA